MKWLFRKYAIGLWRFFFPLKFDKLSGAEPAYVVQHRNLPPGAQNQLYFAAKRRERLARGKQKKAERIARKLGRKANAK